MLICGRYNASCWGYKSEYSMVPSTYLTCVHVWQRERELKREETPTKYNNSVWYDNIKERYCYALPHGVQGSVYKEGFSLRLSLLSLSILASRIAMGLVGVDKLWLCKRLWSFFIAVSAPTASRSTLFFFFLLLCSKLERFALDIKVIEQFYPRNLYLFPWA